MNVNGTQTSLPTGSLAPTKQSDGVDKEAFLQLLVAQLQNQDPLSPMEGTEFVDQMATFTQVEQQIAQAKSLDMISLQLTGLASNEAVSLIGKDVVIRGNKIAFDGENATGASATLGRSATEVTVTIRDENGNVARTMELGAKPGGALSIQWDGRDSAGNPLPSGGYSMEINAKAADGSSVDVSQDVAGRVVGVSFDKGFPEIILASGARAPISDLISVSEVGMPATTLPATTPNATNNPTGPAQAGIAPPSAYTPDTQETE